MSIPRGPYGRPSRKGVLARRILTVAGGEAKSASRRVVTDDPRQKGIGLFPIIFFVFLVSHAPLFCD